MLASNSSIDVKTQYLFLEAALGFHQLSYSQKLVSIGIVVPSISLPFGFGCQVELAFGHESIHGILLRIEREAFDVPGSNNSNLMGHFFRPFRGDQWIVDLDENNSYAVVGTPGQKHCRIFSRAPATKSNILGMLIERLRANGFDLSRLQHTCHSSL